MINNNFIDIIFMMNAKKQKTYLVYRLNLNSLWLSHYVYSGYILADNKGMFATFGAIY